MSEHKNSSSAFSTAGNKAGKNIVAEFIGFLAMNKKWWMLPILIVLLAMGLLIVAAGSGIAPFIYSLF